MRKQIILSADSCCDITAEMAERYGIHRIHPMILLEGNTYRDGVEIHPQDLYDAFFDRGVMAQTTAINSSEYIEHFRQWTERGYEIVHICIGSGFSACYQNCRLAAEELGGVYPVDSRALSAALGLLAMEASAWIEAGLSASEVAARVEALVPKQDGSFLIDNLSFLRAGGRCSALAALGANLLSLKPAIVVNPETSGMEVGKKYRGAWEKALLQYTADRLKSPGKIAGGRAVVVHAGAAPDAVRAVEELVRETGLFREVFVTVAGCMISCHCGPNTLGVMYLRDC